LCNGLAVADSAISVTENLLLEILGAQFAPGFSAHRSSQPLFDFNGLLSVLRRIRR